MMTSLSTDKKEDALAMQIGLLNVCTPKDEEEFNALELTSFEKFFGFANDGVTLIEYRVTEGEMPAGVSAHEAYLITGSPVGVYDDASWLPPLASFIREAYDAGKKLVGICFGHQMLAHSLGGHAQKSEKGWGVGWHTFQVDQKMSWMNSAHDQLNLYFCHQDQVEQLPDQAIRLGGNAFCPNAMFVIKDQVLGIQGHPEFTQEMMTTAINHLKPQLAENVVEHATSTLHQERDHAVVADWIVNFLTQDYSQL